MKESSLEFHSYTPDDAEAIHEINVAAAETDQVDPHSTLESVKSLEEILDAFGKESETPNPDVLIATDTETGYIVGYGTIRWWQEEDGTFVYVHHGQVHPEHRRKGLGSELLGQLQNRIHEVAEQHDSSQPRVYGANASSSQPGTVKLLENNGYKKVYSQVEMELTDFSRLPETKTPEGFELRPITSDEEKRKVYQANKEVYAGSFASTAASEEDYKGFLEDNPDTSTWKVAWAGDEVAGFVLSRPNGKEAEIMEVSVLPKYRRRGLASFLMIEGMRELEGNGAEMIRLHTGAEGIMGGRPLYESLGFKALKEHHRYRKPV